MLIIHRREGQAVWIGNALVRVARDPRSGSKVRLEIDAPPEVLVSREELGKPPLRKHQGAIQRE